MLIKDHQRPGYFLDTKTKKHVKDPNYQKADETMIEQERKTINGEEVNELLGIQGNRHLVLDPNPKYIITEEEWKLATNESRLFMSKAIQAILFKLNDGSKLESSVLFVVGHKSRLVDFACSLLLNARAGGNTFAPIQNLALINSYAVDKFDQDTLVVMVPYRPTDEQLSTLSGLLAYRDQKGLPTICIAQKYDVQGYRIMLNTSNQPRYDLLSLISLKQERKLEQLESFADDVQFDFVKSRSKEEKVQQQPNNPEVKADYEQQLRRDFVDISTEKANSSAHNIFERMIKDSEESKG